MNKFHYVNPLTPTFQHEYALLMALFNLFQEVQHSSFLLLTLKLYYMELSDSRKTPPFPKQEKLNRKMSFWLERDVLGKIEFPMMRDCKAVLTSEAKEDGSHRFTFSDGIYGFTVFLKKKEERIVGIETEN